MNNKKTIHEINNLLASLSFTAELLARKPATEKEQKSQAKSIIADAKKIQKLLKKLAN